MPDHLLAEYRARIVRWATHLATMEWTPAQMDGSACVKCGHDFDTRPDMDLRIVGVGPHGHQVGVCADCDTPPPVTLEADRLDDVVAAAVMLSAYAPGVQVDPREVGADLLTLAGAL